MNVPSPLGIIAGGGVLPGHIARRCREQGREVFIVALEQQADPEVVGPWPHAWVRLGAAASAIRLLREAGARDVVMAGPVRRPSLAELRPDGRTLRFLARGALSAGDDGLLSAVVRALEQEEGFRVLAVQDVAGGLLAHEGPAGLHAPSPEDIDDIGRGAGVLRALAPVDVGQAVVVQAGVVLGIEAVEGTDALVRRAGDLRRAGKPPVLVKLPKSGQSRQVDLPAVGPGTVEAAHRAGFSGIAVEAGGCLVIERERAVALADEAGLFLLGIRIDGG